jgi:hypothetical protein
MELNPNNQEIYKWIGDLLYEGLSYQDALKSYSEMGSEEDFVTNIMKLKCLMRVGSMKEIQEMMKKV